MSRAQTLSFSVVISTRDRAAHLANCLRSLEQQDYFNFEVIVVKGPCSDNTDDVLNQYVGKIRIAECFEGNLSKSRNIGIDAAAGDIVAFIDDDSVADRKWLTDLAAAYSSSDVGGVGGIVYDHTGRALQYKYSACTRYGRTLFSQDSFSDQHIRPRADPFLYLQGTNATFRRSALIEIGGFNEQIAYYHDETDVCLRIIDSGYKIVSLDQAAVFHKYAASDKRDHQRTVFHPYNIVRSQYIFVLQNGTTHHLGASLHWELEHFSEEVRNAGHLSFRSGVMTDQQLKTFQAEVSAGIIDGLRLGSQPRPHRPFVTPVADSFLRFETRSAQREVLRICFISQEYPPHDYGGIGRFTYDLATGFADRGHDVHVVSHADGPTRTDFEDGVWIHRLSNTNPIPAAAVGDELQYNYRLLAENYHEVDRLHRLSPIDVVSAPIWNTEGALIACDDRLPTVTTLMTPLRAIVEIHDSWRTSKHTQQLLKLEQASYRTARYVHAISQSILDNISGYYGPP